MTPTNLSKGVLEGADFWKLKSRLEIYQKFKERGDVNKGGERLESSVSIIKLALSLYLVDE